MWGKSREQKPCLLYHRVCIIHCRRTRRARLWDSTLFLCAYDFRSVLTRLYCVPFSLHVVFCREEEKVTCFGAPRSEPFFGLGPCEADARHAHARGRCPREVFSPSLSDEAHPFPSAASFRPYIHAVPVQARYSQCRGVALRDPGGWRPRKKFPLPRANVGGEEESSLANSSGAVQGCASVGPASPEVQRSELQIRGTWYLVRAAAAAAGTLHELPQLEA